MDINSTTPQPEAEVEKIIVLSKPISDGNTTYDRLHLRIPDQREAVRLPKIKDSFEYAIAILSACTKIPKAVLYNLSARDMQKASDWFPVVSQHYFKSIKSNRAKKESDKNGK